MAITMVSELAGAGPGVLDGLRELGGFDKMNSAPGFPGHWCGTMDKGLCVIELWEPGMGGGVARGHGRRPDSVVLVR